MSDARSGRGVAVRGAARAGAGGRVVSVHHKAVYLELDGALVALVAPEVELGPLHLRNGPLPAVVAGERVRCDGSRIAARSWAVRCDVPVWEGTLPVVWGTGAGSDGRPELSGGTGDAMVDASCAGQDARAAPARDASRVVAKPSGPTGRGDHVAGLPLPEIAMPEEVPVDPERLGAALRAGAVEEMARFLGGLGPGLTPAGDDLLAGLVLTARALWGSTAESRLVEAVGTVRTTAPAAAFLHWAARGQSLAPAHDVLVALAAGDPAAAERAGRRLSAIGASSGRCLLAGVLAGVAQLPRLDTQSARAGAGAALCTRAR